LKLCLGCEIVHVEIIAAWRPADIRGFIVPLQALFCEFLSLAGVVQLHLFGGFERVVGGSFQLVLEDHVLS
jgi:hypothetical protein